MEHKPPRRENWVVGDVVEFIEGRPKRIVPRRNELNRRGFGGVNQTLCANLDILVIVTACGEAFKPGLIDRFIVSAGHAGIEPIIVLNKADLPDSDEKIEIVSKYSLIGYEVYVTSAQTGDGLHELANALKDKTSSMVGHSGVGKTSLLNQLIPNINRATAQIHGKTDQGRHKTSFALLVNLPNGGAVIDSPGVRQFAPSGLEECDVSLHFPGFANIEGACKFRDCLHITEPQCVIRSAVEDGQLDRSFYESYIRLVNSVKENQEPHYLKNK